MFARIATFQVGEADQVEETIDAARAQVEETWASPPEGLETAKDLYMLVDRENLTGVGITLFETEDDLRRADEALNAMSPRGAGQRTNVAFYEVMLHKQR
jgi:hypothetical protein